MNLLRHTCEWHIRISHVAQAKESRDTCGMKESHDTCGMIGQSAAGRCRALQGGQDPQDALYLQVIFRERAL